MVNYGFKLIIVFVGTKKSGHALSICRRIKALTSHQLSSYWAVA